MVFRVYILLYSIGGEFFSFLGEVSILLLLKFNYESWIKDNCGFVLVLGF